MNLVLPEQRKQMDFSNSFFSQEEESEPKCDIRNLKTDELVSYLRGSGIHESILRIVMSEKFTGRGISLFSKYNEKRRWNLDQSHLKTLDGLLGVIRPSEVNLF